MLKRSPTIAAAMLCALYVLPTGAVQSEEENLAALATPRCEIPGLAVVPPKPWYSVPVDSAEEGIEGCQMIWEEGEQYMGILRLMSFDLSDRPKQQADWESFVIGFEAVVLERMGFKLGKPTWKRDSVPVSGEGFGNGKAAGFLASLEGGTTENEVHFMLFESASHKYVISGIMPSREASPGVYKANTDAMGTVMRTLQPN